MVAAGSLTSSIIEWRVIFFSMAVFGIVIAALTLLFVEKSK
ncbi:major facilitator superfamily (MFS) transporter [Legionella cincinnatiensis]|uniref:Major facilitator superfamily (MFS) transporter n=1 Tax=Legionella cincinnatiensis TaxID=28085 RepID=A0A378IK09_9GAMM|nr:major facilitator superfamily (MFS) transporter [Legionella cincinnatiensis]